MSVNVVDNNVTVTAVQEIEVANDVVTNAVVNEYPNTISVKSNEFAVVGDGLFATTKEEVPGWMREPQSCPVQRPSGARGGSWR